MRWYQTAVINGQLMPQMRQGDSSEDRWNNLILPLLPEGESLIELGSNAGFYLRKAKDLGFAVKGIDNQFAEQARIWEEADPKGIETIDGNLMDWDFPCSSIVLLANVHYWLTMNESRKLFRRLKSKTPYILIVGRYKYHPEMKSTNNPKRLVRHFGQPIKSTRTRKHYAYLFKTDLEEVEIKELIEPLKEGLFYKSFTEFLEGNGDLYKEYLKKRVSSKDERYYEKHLKLFESIKEHGLKRPLSIDGNIVNNGNHRLVILDYLGQKRVVCKRLSI